LTDEIYKALALNSYRSSVVMAKERGAFPVFSHKLEETHPFIRQLLALDPVLAEWYLLHGRRNIACTTTAPTGSTSLLTRTTSGCEPVLFVKSKRKKKINPNDKAARVDEVDKMGDKWQVYDVFHHGVSKWMQVTGRDDIEGSPYNGSTVEEIDWLKKIDIQAAAQKWICHSISNTTNLPEDVSTEMVEKLCWHAWETGCKGVTIYRIGSRDAVIVKESDAKGQPVDIVETNAPKRQKELTCDIHRATVQGETYLVLVGLLEGHPYEVFAGLFEHVEVPKKTKKGVLIKNGKKDGVATYNLRIPIGDDDDMLFKDVVNLFDNPQHGALTRMISLSMRHGVPMQFLVEQLKKDKHSGLQSFSNVIARVLKSYIIDGTKSTSEKTCEECGAAGLVYQTGCVSCTSCGWSKC
jgi:ribonucleoside-diphosphate reductase alpha chain